MFFVVFDTSLSFHVLIML